MLQLCTDVPQHSLKPTRLQFSVNLSVQQIAVIVQKVVMYNQPRPPNLMEYKQLVAGHFFCKVLGEFVYSKVTS